MQVNLPQLGIWSTRSTKVLAGILVLLFATLLQSCSNPPVLPPTAVSAATPTTPGVVVLSEHTLEPIPTQPQPSATVVSEAASSSTPTSTFTNSPSATPIHAQSGDTASPATPTHTISATTPTSTRIMVQVTASSANLRAGPCHEYAALAFVYQGEELEVLGCDLLGGWLVVRTASGEEGWVILDALQVDFSLEGLAMVEPPPLPTKTPRPEKPPTKEPEARPTRGCNCRP